MKKKILVTLFFVFVTYIFFGYNKIYAADIWIYTGKNNVQYYLRDHFSIHRTGHIAHVVRVANKDWIYLTYLFDLGRGIHYRALYGNLNVGDNALYKDDNVIYRGDIEEDSKNDEIASILWYKKLFSQKILI